MVHPWVVVVWVNCWSFLVLEELHVSDGVLSPEAVLFIVEGSSDSTGWVKNVSLHVANVGVDEWVKSVNLLWSWISVLRLSCILWFGLIFSFTFTFTFELNIVLSVVESGVGLGNLWVEDVNLFWLKDLNFLSFLDWLSSSWLLTDLGSTENAVSIGSSEFSISAAISRLLIVVEFLALHGNVLTEILVSVHASSK